MITDSISFRIDASNPWVLSSSTQHIHECGKGTLWMSSCNSAATHPSFWPLITIRLGVRCYPVASNSWVLCSCNISGSLTDQYPTPCSASRCLVLLASFVVVPFREVVKDALQHQNNYSLQKHIITLSLSLPPTYAIHIADTHPQAYYRNEAAPCIVNHLTTPPILTNQ